MKCKCTQETVKLDRYQELILWEAHCNVSALHRGKLSFVIWFVGVPCSQTSLQMLLGDPPGATSGC